MKPARFAVSIFLIAAILAVYHTVLPSSDYNTTVALTLLLAILAVSTRWGLAAAAVASVIAMLGASALYHRVTWSPRVRPWMRRLDHTTIFIFMSVGS